MKPHLDVAAGGSLHGVLRGGQAAGRVDVDLAAVLDGEARVRGHLRCFDRGAARAYSHT